MQSIQAANGVADLTTLAANDGHHAITRRNVEPTDVTFLMVLDAELSSQPDVCVSTRHRAGLPDRVEGSFRAFPRVTRRPVGQCAEWDRGEGVQANVCPAGTTEERPWPLAVLASVDRRVVYDLDGAAVVRACCWSRKRVLDASGRAPRRIPRCLRRLHDQIEKMGAVRAARMRRAIRGTEGARRCCYRGIHCVPRTIRPTGSSTSTSDSFSLRTSALPRRWAFSSDV